MNESKNLNWLAHECGSHKFNGCQFSHPKDTFLVQKKLTEIENKGDFLIEGCLYENDTTHFILTKTKQPYLTVLDINKFEITTHAAPECISFCFVYNNNPDYKIFLDKAISHYSNLNLPFKTEITIYKENMDTFDMSSARNGAMMQAKFEHLFVLDLDYYLDESEILRIINIWNTKKHCGVFNLKPNYTSGNGLWFGKKEYLIEKNKYSEKFKKFWYEDTEYFMNFSRIGILPMVIFTTCPFVDHPRGHTSPYENLNKELFKNIFEGIERR